MADPIIVNQIIKAMGLNGQAEQEKRAELEKLSNAELTKILSNTKEFDKTSAGVFLSLDNNKWDKNIKMFNPEIIAFQDTDFSSSSSNEKVYTSTQQKELDRFLGDFLFNSSTAGLAEITDYNKNVGWANITDRAVNGFKVLTGQEDRIALQNRLSEEQKESKKLKDIANKRPAVFESMIERKYGVPYSHKNVEALKNKAEEYTRITAHHEKYQQLSQGLKELKNIIREEQEYNQARKNLKGPALAALTPPKTSSNQKFGEIMLNFCNGDKELLNTYMQKLNADYSSRDEIIKDYPNIVSNLETQMKTAYEKELNGKDYALYTNEFNSACQRVIGRKDAKTAAKNFVENAKTQAAYTEIGLTIATSLLLPGSSAVKATAQKLGPQGVKAAMTFTMGAAPATLETLNAASSEAGFTDEKIDAIKEKFKNGMLYGSFGAYASGPLGQAVEKVLSKNPAAFSNIVSKTMAKTSETTADVLFDRMTSDLSFSESLKQNGGLNFGMMFAGGILSKVLKKNFQELTVTKNSDGSFSLKDTTGKEILKNADENTLMGYIIGQAVKETKQEGNIRTVKYKNVFKKNDVFVNDEKIASTKSELLKQIASQGYNPKANSGLDLEILRFIDSLKTKEDYQKASILFKNSELNYDIRENFQYLTDIKDAEIMAMLMKKGYGRSGGADYQYKNIISEIKKNPLLYELYEKGLPYVNNKDKSWVGNESYALVDVSSSVKTQEQLQAVLKLLEEADSSGQRFAYKRGLIKNTLEKYVKTPDDIESYVNFVNKFTELDDHWYLTSIAKTDEGVDAIYSLFDNSKNAMNKETLKDIIRAIGNDTDLMKGAASLHQKGVNGFIISDLLYAAKNYDGTTNIETLKSYAQYDNSTDMVLDAIEKNGRYSANLTLLKSHCTDNNGNFDKQTFEKALSYRKQGEFWEYINKNIDNCKKADGTIDKKLLNTVDELTNSGYPLFITQRLIPNMRNINAYSKEISFDEAAERFKRIAKNNPEFINKQTINQSIDILESSTDFYRNPHRFDAALKLAENGVCPAKYLFDSSSNYERLFNKCTLEDGTIDNNVIDKAIELHKLSVPSLAIDGNIDIDLNRLKQIHAEGYRSYELVQMVGVSDDAHKFIRENIKPEDITAADIKVIDAALPFKDFDSVREMSLEQKRDFLSCLLKCNTDLLDTKNVSGLIKILPNTAESYIKTIKQVSQSMNIRFEPLAKNDINVFDKNLNSLTNTLKNTDLSDLEQINLQLSQKNFVSQVEKMCSSLNKEEKLKIYDYYGFNIKDGKLLGYPDTRAKDLSLADITDSNTIDVLNRMKPLVNDYTNNNFITVKDYPQLTNDLKDISKLMPEIFRQIDGSNLPVTTVKTLQKVVQKPNFDALSDSDKKVLTMAVLLHNTDNTSGSIQGCAFDGFFIGQKLGLSEAEAVKLYKVIESSDIVEKFMNTEKRETIIPTRGQIIKGNDRANKFDLMAFKLKEGNTFELAQMLYSSKEADGLTRNFDKMLENRIKEIKSEDFILPQTSQSELYQKAKIQTIKDYNVKVVNASDIKDFYAFIHTPEVSFASSSNTPREMKFSNFDAFKTLEDDKVICTSYIGKDSYAAAKDTGFIFNVAPEHQYAAYGHDMFSLSKNIPDMLVEYYRDRGYNALRGKGEKAQHRAMVSDNIKAIRGLSNEEYIKRLDNIKAKTQGQPLTMELLSQTDPEFADAYKELLARKNAQRGTNSALLRNDKWWNEVLVSNPEITAIYTKDLSNLPDEYLKKAQEENLPIVVLK